MKIRVEIEVIVRAWNGDDVADGKPGRDPDLHASVDVSRCYQNRKGAIEAATRAILNDIGEVLPEKMGRNLPVEAGTK